jgi:hypothetical protein
MYAYWVTLSIKSQNKEESIKRVIVILSAEKYSVKKKVDAEFTRVANKLYELKHDK